MAVQAYKEFNFRGDTLAMISVIAKIITTYSEQGMKLSVRQVYYQLVARGHIENTEQSYKRTASIINDARIAGYLDWDDIEDRNRDIECLTRWENGSSIVHAAANGFHMDMWNNQEHRVFVIVEKAALAGVLDSVCRAYDVPLLAARGYPSVSIVREMALEHIVPAINGDISTGAQQVIVLHLGDHDPSGIDMTRDLDERFQMFIEPDVTEPDMFYLKRIALSMAQIEETSPPPNPAKTTDARFRDYMRKYGDKSWELDALEPAYLRNLVTGHIKKYINPALWKQRETEIETIRERLKKTAKRFEKEGV